MGTPPTFKFCPNCGVKINRELNSIHCPQCKKAIPLNSKYCPYCGTDLLLKTSNCPNCGKKVLVGSEYCQNCGFTLSEATTTAPLISESKLDSIPTIYNVFTQVSREEQHRNKVLVAFSLSLVGGLINFLTFLYIFLYVVNSLSDFLIYRSLINLTLITIIPLISGIFLLYGATMMRKMDHYSIHKGRIIVLVFSIIGFSEFLLGVSTIIQIPILIGGILGICGSIFAIVTEKY